VAHSADSSQSDSLSQLSETLLSTETVFQGSFLKIEKDMVRTSDGLVRPREYILHPGAALIVPRSRDGRVLMVQQYRHALRKIFWEFPAGKKDPGEDSLTTAKRELHEETGFTANRWQFLTRIHPAIGYANEQIDLYLAEDLTTGVPQPDPGEHLLPSWKTLPELQALIEAGELSDVKTQIAAFWVLNFHASVST